MKQILHRFAIIALLLLTNTQGRGCTCQYICSFLAQVNAMFSAYLPGTFNWEEQVVIVKAAYIDSIPDSYGGSKIKLLTQFYGRPVKDTFNFLPGGTDCDLYLRDFHQRNQDTLFLLLHRNVNSRFGDTLSYSMSMCGRHYAVVKNDSIVENCSAPKLTASAMADSLRKAVRAVLSVDASILASNLKIYPNPTTDKFTIEGVQGGKANILSIVGQQMMSVTITSNKQVLNFSGLPAGTYMLVLTRADGTTSSTRITKE